MPAWMKWAISLAIGFAIIGIGFRVSWGAYILRPFFVLNCLVLIIVVLLQSGKAADLAGAFGGAGSQTAFGPRGAANVLSKATTWCAIMFMVCALAMVLRIDKGEGVDQSGSVLQNVSKPASKPATTPATNPAAPQATHDSLPAGQQPATQPPASQTPGGQQPAQQTPAKPQSSSPQTGQQPPAQQPPAGSQPAPPPKKP